MAETSATTRVIADADRMAELIDSLANQVLEHHGDCADLAMLGIQRRGADLAERIKALLDARLGRKLPFGKLDINLYRDDWSGLAVQPRINCSEIPFDVTAHKIVLVDDVLFTGRTIRAALEAVLDYGRPKRVELMCLVDRGNRELPIQPDFVSLRLETSLNDHVDVLVRERDGEDKVCLRPAGGSAC